jgi:phospholipid/cholesterol/gamma-HCH transport system substrate-binding protein
MNLPMSMMAKLLVPMVLLALVVAALVAFVFDGGHQKTLTADFPRAVSLYVGSDVRVLGVPIGKVDSVTPSGTQVIVKMHYDPDVKLPAGAKAVIVSPSIVGDRFVQLTPAYTGGQTLADGATLDQKHTAVPLELDQIYSSLDDLSTALGPNGANKKGALTDLLDTTAANFGGQGKKFHQTIENFSRLSGTLADNKDNLFGSVRQIEGFVGTLAHNDHTVRRFNQALAQVSGMLKGERGDLAASLHNLGIALDHVSGFVRENRKILGKNITGLDQVTQILVKQRSALAETLRDAPLALNNLALTYNPQAGTLDTRANIGELGHQITSDPSTFLCGILDQANQGGQACNLIQQLLSKNRPGALSGGSRRTGPTGVDQSDPTLGGLVEAGR